MYRFMWAHRAEFSVRLMAQVFEVGRRGYYAWLKRRQPTSAKVADEQLLQRIRAIHTDSGGCYGSRRVHADLQASKVKINLKAVQRLMRSMGLQGHHARQKVVTTQRSRRGHGIEDRVQRQFERSQPNELWVADTTYLPVRNGHAYLAVVMDACTRQVLGWALDVRQDTRLMLRALRMAASRGSVQGVVHHSDQGSQYASQSFQSMSRRHGIHQSMGSVGGLL